MTKKPSGKARKLPAALAERAQKLAVGKRERPIAAMRARSHTMLSATA